MTRLERSKSKTSKSYFEIKGPSAYLGVQHRLDVLGLAAFLAKTFGLLLPLGQLPHGGVEFLQKGTIASVTAAVRVARKGGSS